MVCQTTSVVPVTHAQLPTHRSAALPVAIFLHSIRVLDRCLVMACLAAAGAALASSNVVQYSYDAAGNVVTIQRLNPAPITLTGFVPATGPMGAVIAITGTGFSATPANNAVAFNGVAAVVVSASPTTLTVAVPAGATTGKVTVTVAGNTAASMQDFIVAAAGMPTITGFAPAAGPSGTTVNVDGANFNPVPGATTVKLNQSSAPASSVTTAQLAFAVPAATGSGRIRVTTGAGTAVSTGDFIVPPGGVGAADIIATTRLVADGPAQSIGLFATSKSGLILFDGIAGAWLSLHVGNFTVSPAGATIAYTIYKPDNTQFASGTLAGTNLSLHLPALPMIGTYSLLLRTGIAQVSLDAKLETNAFVPADGTTLSVARSAGQSTRALIAGVAGEQKALMVSGLVTVPANNNLDVTVALPNGSTFRRAAAFGLGTTTPLPSFTTTGTHSVVLVASAGTTQSAFRVALLGGVAIAVDGAAADVPIANPGEGARLTFAGVAGENLGLGVTGVTLSPSSVTTTNVSVYKPDALLFASVNCATDGKGCATNLENLPVTGTYSIIVQPSSGATGTQRLWLSHDVAGIVASGVPLGVALSRPGQNARLTFAGTAGALVALQVRAVATNPPGQGVLVIVSQPDKSLVVYTHLTGAGQTLVAPPLPVTGTYTVFLEPEYAAQGAATATMEVLLDPGRTLATDGPTLDTSIAVAGGSARYLFAGTAGQNLGLGVSNLALNPRGDAIVTIHKPDGVQLAAYTCAANSGGCGANLGNLPTNGTYGIVVRPAAGVTGEFSATLSSDLLGSLNAGGSALALTLDRPGRNARLTFAGTAGQTLRLSWSGVAIAGPPGYAFASISTAGGSVFGNAIIANGVAGGYDIPALPASANYTVFVDPPAGATLNATLQLVAR